MQTVILPKKCIEILALEQNITSVVICLIFFRNCHKLHPNVGAETQSYSYRSDYVAVTA